MVPLHRFYNDPELIISTLPTRENTANLVAMLVETRDDLVFEMTVACAFPEDNRFEGTEAWHRYLQDHGNWADYDHFYTTWQDGDKDTSSDIGDYKWEGVAAYIYDADGAQPDNTVPLHRWYSDATVDHVYAIPGPVKDAWDNESSLRYEGVEGYVYPYSDPCPFVSDPTVHLDDATIVSQSPVHAGDTITGSFTITNDHLYDFDVGLGMSIRKTGGGQEIVDADLGEDHERVVSVSQQVDAVVVTRPFTIPSSTGSR
jgi:hypothetical protein